LSASPFEFMLPDLGEGTREAEVRRWLVAVGEIIEEHQPVVEVETDKAVVEVPAPRGGRVLSLGCREGETIAVGSVLMTIGTAGAASSEAGQPPAPQAASAEEEAEERPPSYGIVGELPEAVEPRPVVTPAPAQVEPAEFLAMPGVRALAQQQGIELIGLRGSGPRGCITRDDVLAAAGAGAGTAAEAAAVQRQPLGALRRSIASRLQQSRQQTVSVTVTTETDVSELWELKTREAPELEGRGLHLTFLPFFMKAVQHALAEFPRFNAAFDAEKQELLLYRDCHLGIAVDTGEGLLVPVVRDVGHKSVVQLAAELAELTRRAEARTLSREQLRGSTFTITNFGGFGGRFATPVINLPNVAILGCGGIAEHPWVVGDQVVPRRILPLSLSFDHRVVDGAGATRFLNRIARYLGDPGLLFIESV